MTSSFTSNKHIEEPASGDYDNAWAAPINANWTLLDTALGGRTSIVVTGVTGPTIALTLSQYQPPNIVFSGVLSANLIYYVPSGIGGLWSVFNNTTGSFTLSFGVAPSSSYTIPQGQRGYIISDGTTSSLSQTLSFAQFVGQILNAQVPSSAVTQWQGALSIAFTQVTGIATTGQIPALPASQITSGTFANARISQASVTQFQAALAIAFSQLTGTQTVAQLPANAYRGTLGSGNVTVQSGGSPSGGSSGDIFLIY